MCWQALFRTGWGGYTLIDENSLVSGFSFDAVRDYLLKHPNVSPDRVGWYFQQFLKFAFAQTEYCGEYYLTWDADTLPTSQIYFFQDGHPLFTAKTEYHVAYFHTLEKLLGMGKTAPFSFIAEHMMFCKEVVLELIEAINCSPVLGDSWFEKIINACDFKADDGSIFSEFETYGTFCCLKRPDLYQVRQLNTFRCAAMLCGRHITDYVMKALSSLDIATFEIYHGRVERRKLILQRRLSHPARTAHNALKKIARLVRRGS